MFPSLAATRILGNKYVTSTSEQFEAILDAEYDSELATRIGTFATQFEKALANGTVAEYVCHATAYDYQIAAFVAHGPLHVLSRLGEEAEYSIGRILECLDPEECQITLHAFVKARLQSNDAWATREWNLMHRATKLFPQAYMNPDAHEHVWTAINSLHNVPRDAHTHVVNLANMLEVDRSIRFCMNDGPNRMLQLTMDDASFCKPILTILQRCAVHSINALVYAPSLIHVLSCLLRNGHDVPFTRDLVEHSCFTVRLVRECGENFNEIVQCLWELPSWDDNVRNMFKSTWPSRICDAIGQSCNPMYVTTSMMLSYTCPLTRSECKDPVVASDGHTYERDAVLPLIVESSPSPFSKVTLNEHVVPNRVLL